MQFTGLRIKAHLLNGVTSNRVQFYSEQATTMIVGDDSHLQGVFTLPDGRVSTGLRDSLTGALYAKDITLGYSNFINTVAVELVPMYERILDATKGRRDGVNSGGVITLGHTGNSFALMGDSASIQVPQNWNAPEYTFTGFVKSSKLPTLPGSDSMVLDSTEWSYIALQKEGDQRPLYVNGIEIVDSTIGVAEDSVSVTLGDAEFEGLLEEVRFLNYAVAKDWIMLDYLQAEAVKDLILYEPLSIPEFTGFYSNTEEGVQLTLEEIPLGGYMVRIERKSSAIGVWMPITPVQQQENLFIDYNVIAGISYEYRCRFESSSTLTSAWSTAITVAVPELQGLDEYLRILTMSILSAFDTSAVVEVVLFERFSGGAPLWTSIGAHEVTQGWLDLRIPVTEELRAIIKGQTALFWGLRINGVFQSERLPLVAGTRVINDPYRISGDDTPIGRINADIGTLYTDVIHNKLYFKFGLSTQDWKKVN